MNEAYGALLKAQRDLARDRAAARELPDEQEVDSMFSARTLAEIEAQKKFYAAGRAALDLFLGGRRVPEDLRRREPSDDV